MRSRETKLKRLCLNSIMFKRPEKQKSSFTCPVGNSRQAQDRSSTIFRQRQTNKLAETISLTGFACAGTLGSFAGHCVAMRTQGCDSCQECCPWRSALRWHCFSLCRRQSPPAWLPRAFPVVSIQLGSHPQSSSPNSHLGWHSSHSREFLLLSFGISLCWKAGEGPETHWTPDKSWPVCYAEMLARTQRQSYSSFTMTFSSFLQNRGGGVELPRFIFCFVSIFFSMEKAS